MHLTILKNKLIRRLNVNLTAYLGKHESAALADEYLKPTTSKEWFDGYSQAIKDAEDFLSRLEIYEPYETPDL